MILNGKSSYAARCTRRETCSGLAHKPFTARPFFPRQTAPLVSKPITRNNEVVSYRHRTSVVSSAAGAQLPVVPLPESQDKAVSAWMHGVDAIMHHGSWKPARLLLAKNPLCYTHFCHVGIAHVSILCTGMEMRVHASHNVSMCME